MRIAWVLFVVLSFHYWINARGSSRIKYDVHVYRYFQKDVNSDDTTETKTQTRHGNVQVYKLIMDDGSYSLVKTAVIGLYMY